MSFRAGLCLGSLAALGAALPAALRAASAGTSVLAAWALLAGGTALFVAPLLALAREARPFGRGARALLLGGALAALPLAVFGRVLQQNTHHRPLGAATFAVLALLALLGLALVGYRVLGLVRERPRIASALVPLVGVACAALFVQGAAAPGLQRHVLDAALALVLAAAALTLPLSTRVRERLSVMGLPLWAALSLAGVVLSRGAVGDAVGALAPVLAPLNGW